MGAGHPTPHLCPQTHHPSAPVPSPTFHGPRALQGQHCQQRQRDAPSSGHRLSWQRAARAGPDKEQALLLGRGAECRGPRGRGTGPPQVPSHSEGALPLTRLFPGRATAPSTPQSRQTDRRSGRAPQGRTVELGPRTPPERALGRGQVGAAEAGEPQCRRGPAAPSPGSLPQRGPSVSGSPAGPGSAW